MLQMGQVLHLKSNYCCCMWSSKSHRVLACLFYAPLHIWVKYVVLYYCVWQFSAKRRDGQLAWILLHYRYAASVIFYVYLHGYEHLSVCFTSLTCKSGIHDFASHGSYLWGLFHYCLQSFLNAQSFLDIQSSTQISSCSLTYIQ